MNFFWLPKAERGLRDLGLSPVLTRVQRNFDRFDFYAPPPGFGSTSRYEAGRLMYFVSFRIGSPTLANFSMDDDIITELVVKCMPPSSREREQLRLKRGTVFRGIVLGVSNASEVANNRVVARAGGSDR